MCTNEEAEQDIASSEKCTWQSDKGTGWQHDCCWYKQIYLHLLSITMVVFCNLRFLSKLPENITGDSCCRCFPRVKYYWIKLQYVQFSPSRTLRNPSTPEPIWKNAIKVPIWSGWNAVMCHLWCLNPDSRPPLKPPESGTVVYRPWATYLTHTLICSWTFIS